jgi:hypothetical protein
MTGSPENIPHFLWSLRTDSFYSRVSRLSKFIEFVESIEFVGFIEFIETRRLIEIKRYGGDRRQETGGRCTERSLEN